MVLFQSGRQYQLFSFLLFSVSGAMNAMNERLKVTFCEFINCSSEVFCINIPNTYPSLNLGGK